MSIVSAEPIISEFLTNNATGVMDEDLERPDWIEIYNPDATTVNLNGWALTDNAGLPQKWVFPAVSLASQQFLRVWASGKNRRVVGPPLHTNFSLNADGEYLALVRPNGTVRQDFGPQYPDQDPDRSYGISFLGTPLVQNGSPVDVLVPNDNALATTWMQRNFTPSGWLNGTSAVGFGVLQSGMTIRVLKKNPTFGGVSTLAETDALLDPANSGQVSQTYTQILPVMNLLGEYGDAHYGNNTPITLADPNNYVAQATGYLNVLTAGTFTFGINSDDGGRIRIDGANVMVDDTNHGPADHLGTVTLSAGLHTFEAVYWEAGGGDEGEFYVARGSFTAWDAVNFALVGQSTAQGIDVLTPPQSATAASGLVQTNIGALMQNIRPTAYLRFPFDVQNPAAFTSLTLNIRYADGFQAYLNGQPVGFRNRQSGLDYTTTASATRTVTQALTPDTLNLNAFLGTLVAGQNVLAIHGLNNSVSDGSFLMAPELLGGGLDLNQGVYFNTPTPAATNSPPSSYGKVADTVFLPTRGTFPNLTTTTTPFPVTISCATPGATIRYTTDGSKPSPTNGTTYTDPISVTASMVIRAMAYKSNWDLTNVDTHTYLLPDEVITQSATGTPPPGWPTGPINGQPLDYGMDPDIVNHANPALGGPAQVKAALAAIPSICLTVDRNDLFSSGSGIYVNPNGRGYAWERSANVEILNHAQGELSESCGVRIRGGYSRSAANPKHSFHLYFRSDYGSPKLRFPLFGDAGADEFDNLDLRTAQNYSWSYHGDANNTFLREEFSRQTQGDLGQPYSHGFYFHLYLNGQYWGLFATEERPEAGYAEAYFGGDKADYDVVKSAGSPGGYTTELTNGTATAWQSLWNQAVAHSTAPAPELVPRYFQMQGLAADGLTPLDPLTNPCLLDVNNQIDYLLVVFLVGSSDAPLTGGGDAVNNWFTFRDRTKNQGFKHFAHDMEHSCFAGGDRTGPFVNANLTNYSYSNPQYLHQHLLNNPEYKLRFADRVQKHFFNNGVLTTQKNLDRMNALATTVGNSIIAESARWGDAQLPTTPRTKADWLVARDYLLNNFLGPRNQAVLNQLAADGLHITNPTGVALNRVGGYVTNTTPITLASSATIYYTLNGSDPRLVGGNLNTASATAFSGGTTTTNTLVNWGLDAPGATWKYRDPSIDLGSSDIVVGHPAYAASNWKHPQFIDTGAEWKSGDAELGFADAPRTSINIGPAVRFQACYFRKKFTVANPSLYDSLSLEIKRDDGAIVYINGKEVGRSNMPTGAIGYEYIPGVPVVGGTDEDTFFPVVDPRLVPSVLVAGDNWICVEVHQANSGSSDLTFDLRLQATKTVFPTPIYLNQTGLVTLKARSFDGTNWSALTETQFVANAVPAAINNLVLSEIMYHPSNPSLAEINAGFDSDGDFEFIEMMNIGTTAVDLAQVRFTTGITYDFGTNPGLRFLNPGQRLLLASKPAAFVMRYGNGLPLAGGYAGNLDNAGEILTLVDAANGSIKTFSYGTTGAWPEETDGQGYSLILKNPGTNPDHAVGSNWRSSVSITGNPNQSDHTSLAAWMAASSVTNPLGDDDHDGLDNVLEYALASHPGQPDAQRGPTAGTVDLGAGPHISISFTHRIAADDCRLIPEASTDLVTYDPNAMVLVSRLNLGNGTEELHYRTTMTQTNGSRIYVRLRATVP